jgi:hypothetical protein
MDLRVLFLKPLGVFASGDLVTCQSGSKQSSRRRAYRIVTWEMDAMIILAKQGSSGCMKVKERSYHIEHGIKYTRTVAYISISFTGRDQRGKRVEYARAVEGNFSLFSGLFSWPPNSKKFKQYPSHRIFRCIHGTLNVGKKITNCTVYL